MLTTRPQVRKHYSRSTRGGVCQQPLSSPLSASPSSSRETTPSPLPSIAPSPPRPQPQKLDIPDVFLDQNFDLSNPSTFNTVFPFLSESLGQSSRTNPFTIESHEARRVESSGRLVQERLQHYIDQVSPPSYSFIHFPGGGEHSRPGGLQVTPLLPSDDLPRRSNVSGM